MTVQWDMTTMHGLGNRLHLVHDDAFGVGSELARKACQDRTADGLMVHGRGEDGVYAAIIWNADGSRAEVCGNGLRCVTRLGVEAGRLDAEGDVVRSDAGTHQVRMESDGRVTISMPSPIHGADAVGMRTPPPSGMEVHGSVLTCTCGKELVEVHLLSAGNPHAVVFASADRHASLLPILAQCFEHSKACTAGINVHVADVTEGVMQLASWERGVGPTLACATGATAAVFAAAGIGLVSSGAAVQMPGGVLDVRLERACVWNTGMAEYVGQWTRTMESIDADPPLRA